MGHLTKLPIFTRVGSARATEEAEVEEAVEIAFVYAGGFQRSGCPGTTVNPVSGPTAALHRPATFETPFGLVDREGPWCLACNEGRASFNIRSQTR